MENEEKPSADYSSAEPQPKTIEEKIVHIGDTLNSFSSELQTIQSNLQKRKGETTTIKVLFYTGLIVLLVGFLYTTTTLQRAQLKRMEANIATLRLQMNHELLLTEKTLYEEIQLIQDLFPGGPPGNLREVLHRLNTRLSNLEPKDNHMSSLIGQIKKNSEELSQVYQEQKARKERISNRKPERID